MPNLSIDEIKDLITFCKEHDVSEFKLEDLQFSIAPRLNIPAKTVSREPEDETDLMLNDPLEWERKQYSGK